MSLARALNGDTVTFHSSAPLRLHVMWQEENLEKEEEYKTIKLQLFLSWTVFEPCEEALPCGKWRKIGSYRQTRWDPVPPAG